MIVCGVSTIRVITKYVVIYEVQIVIEAFFSLFITFMNLSTYVKCLHAALCFIMF